MPDHVQARRPVVVGPADGKAGLLRVPPRYVDTLVRDLEARLQRMARLYLAEVCRTRELEAEHKVALAALAHFDAAVIADLRAQLQALGGAP